MHDVGKIGLPDELLRKLGPYSPRRARACATTQRSAPRSSPAAARHCSRRPRRSPGRTTSGWDGGGYPAGLRGREIPLAGRICAICDVYDALISERPYKPAWSVDEALAEIEGEAGAHFDPALFATFLTLREQLRAEGTAPSGRLHAA